jgi:hypothetical protein
MAAEATAADILPGASAWATDLEVGLLSGKEPMGTTSMVSALAAVVAIADMHLFIVLFPPIATPIPRMAMAEDTEADTTVEATAIAAEDGEFIAVKLNATKRR